MIVIRHAEPSDSEAIARVLYESFVEYESQYTVAAFAATVLDTEKVRQRLEKVPAGSRYLMTRWLVLSAQFQELKVCMFEGWEWCREQEGSELANDFLTRSRITREQIAWENCF